MKKIAVLAPTKEDFNNWIKDNSKEGVNYQHIDSFRFGNTLFDGYEEGYNADKMKFGIKNAVLRRIKK